ncbi:response regulator transcription factor [Niallia taxi]|uniref:response regulator transcription factor n=1 Tax=Niallia taxi TaxID=2499688 RepID=UPI003D2E2BF2
MYNFIIVDDEELIRKGTLKKIDKLNLPITCVGEATNGFEAMELLQKNTSHFIITDMDMPLMDGSQLLDNIIRSYPNIKVIIISGFENFSYAQKAIQAKAVSYILKPFSKETLCSALEQILEALHQEEKQLTNPMAETELTLLSHFIIGNITFSKILPQTILSLTDKKLTLATIYFKKTINWNSVTIPYTMLLHPQNDKMAFLLLEEGVSELALPFPSNSYLCGISREFNHPSQLHEAYTQTIAALNKRRFLDEMPLFYYQKDTSSREIIFDNIDEILFFIESGNSQQLKNQLTTLFHGMITSHHMTLNELKKFGLYIIEQTKGMLNSRFNFSTNYTLPIIDKTVQETIFSFNELIEYFLVFLSNIAESMRNEKIYASQDTIENVKKYILKNYDKNIKLDFLSDIFFLNSTYLSTLFKERTGQKYIDFLNSVRIENAKELLKKSERKISHISKAVGYDNPKYFFRVFKKYTGLSPEQYKKQVQSKVNPL